MRTEYNEPYEYDNQPRPSGAAKGLVWCIFALLALAALGGIALKYDVEHAVQQARIEGR